MDYRIQIENIKTSRDLGASIKRLRKACGISQSELAKVSKVAQPTISAVESGHGTLETLSKLIRALKLNLALANGPMTKKQSRAATLLAKVKNSENER